MVWPHPRLLLIAGIISFCSNWQFAFQINTILPKKYLLFLITYVNTSVNTFFNLTDNGYRARQGCLTCSQSEQAWSSTWSTIVSSIYPGTILGFLLTPYLTSKVGVKRTQIITCIPAIFGCFIHMFAILATYQSEHLVTLVLIVGRFLVGIQAGASLCLLPLYIIEVSPENHRPFLSTFQQVSQALGTLLGLLIGSEDIIPLGINRFFWLQIFAVAPTILFLVVLLFTPKTPAQLMRNGDNTLDLVESLNFYHGGTSRFDSMRNEFRGRQDNKENSLNAAISASDWKGFFIGAAAAISYAFTADDLIDSFSAQILTRSENTSDVNASASADIMSVCFGALLLIASVFGTFLIDRFSRRKLLLFGLIGSAISNGAVVIAPNNFVLVTIGFALTKIFIGLGAGAPAWFLTSELVSSSNVSLFQSFSTGLLLTSTMLVTFFYMPLDYQIGNYSILLLATAPSLILSLLLYLFLPETKDRTSAEVTHAIGSSTFSGLKKKSSFSSESSYGAFS